MAGGRNDWETSKEYLRQMNQEAVNSAKYAKLAAWLSAGALIISVIELVI